MDNCIFCKIAKGEIPSKTLYEDEEVIAFHDIRPLAPVHFLIIPRRHLATLAEAATEAQALLGKMLALAPQLALQAGCGVVKDSQGEYQGGFKTLFNVGPKGGQEVYHLHLHVMGPKQS